MNCTNCGRMMALVDVIEGKDGSQACAFECYHCKSVQSYIYPRPQYEAGFDGLGICPNCGDVETHGGHLCVSCQRQWQIDQL